jgi:hypothetical protein
MSHMLDLILNTIFQYGTLVRKRTSTPLKEFNERPQHKNMTLIKMNLLRIKMQEAWSQRFANEKKKI